MLNLKKMISRYMEKVAIIMFVLIVLAVFVFQALNEQRRTRENAVSRFSQMEQVLAENQRDLAEVQNEYSQTCLHNAEVVAYIIEHSPHTLENVEDFRGIAELIEVDEIHIFDKTGKIVKGTHPEYWGFTFDSGEQIGFFKPMLKDKSLRLCQDIAPNTAEGKQMQYSALWSENGEFIVQVGMEPVNVMRVTEKNELSYIFSLLRVNVGVNFYAIDMETGEIVGSTVAEDVGKSFADVGFDMYDMTERGNGFHATVNGVRSYCIFSVMGDNLIGQTISNDVLYERIPGSLLVLSISLVIVAVILVRTVTWYMNNHVVSGIYQVNEKLREITKGNMSEPVDVQSSLEFSELSSHINDMLKSIADNNKKMSYVLTKTNLYMGIYEYAGQSDKVRVTEYVPRILGLGEDELSELVKDCGQFKAFIDKVRSKPLENEDGVFITNKGRFIRLEEINEDGDVFGVVIDVTDEVSKRKQVEAERDLDGLTGLYNRKGLENKLEGLFMEPEKLEFGALIMLDADGLKEINDKYGHDKGDIYLKKIAEVLKNFGMEGSVAARLGGDEFVLFLYNYEDEEELVNTVKTLEYIQKNSSAFLGKGLRVPLRFSFGVIFTYGKKDYAKMLKQADELMYENKRQRKKMIQDK